MKPREKNYKTFQPTMGKIQDMLQEINSTRPDKKKLFVSRFEDDSTLLRLESIGLVYSSYMTIRELFHYLLGWLRHKHDNLDMSKYELAKIHQAEEKSEYPR